MVYLRYCIKVNRIIPAFMATSSDLSICSKIYFMSTYSDYTGSIQQVYQR